MWKKNDFKGKKMKKSCDFQQNCLTDKIYPLNYSLLPNQNCQLP